MSAPTAFYPLPTVPPLPRTPAKPTFTGQTTPASIASGPIRLPSRRCCPT